MVQEKVKLTNSLKTIKKIRLKTFSLFSICCFLFLFLFINLASADDISTATFSQKSNDLGSLTGTGVLFQYQSCISFSSDGLNLYYNAANRLYQFKLYNAWDISTLYLDSFGNYSTPQFISQGFWAVYVLPNGIDVYGGTSCATTDYNCGYVNHYRMTQANNISSLNTTIISSYQGFRQVIGLYVSDDGTRMVVTTPNAAATPTIVTIYSYLLTTPYNPSTAVLKSSYTEGLGSGNINGNFSCTFFTNGGLTMITAPSFQQTFFQWSLSSAYNVTNAQKVASFNPSVTCGGSGCLDGVYINVDAFGQTYLFFPQFTTTNHAYINKYLIGSLSNPSYNETAIFPNLIGDISDNFLSIFPDASTLTNTQRYGYVFVFMFLIAVVLLLAMHSSNHGLHNLSFYILGLLEFVLFIFFIFIGYIGIGVLIILVLLAVLVSYFWIKKGGNST